MNSGNTSVMAGGSTSAPGSTGWPLLDLETALAGPEVVELAKALLNTADRLGIPREGPLPLMETPSGDIVDRELSRTWTIAFRKLSPATQAQLPTLNDLLARVEFSVGEFQNAQRDFMGLAKQSQELEAQALARYHAYRSALERPNLSDASVELRHAIALAPATFSPVPLDRFDPEQIHAVDCVGVTLRCKTRTNLGQGDLVFLKTLDGSYLERSIPEVFEDQKKLATVKHRALLPVMGCGHAAPNQQRPFFTFAYYEGSTLDHYVQRSGVIAPKDFVPLFLSWVEALQAAHQAGVLHRGLRPDCIYIRRKVSGFSGVLSNFGLQFKNSFYQTLIENPALLVRTTYGRSLAGSLDYAAPEQTGQRTEPVGPATDVYSLAKSACLALFGTPHPSLTQWRQGGELLAEILHDCVRENPAERPTLAHIKARLSVLIDPEEMKMKVSSLDPKMAALVASYQPPPGVGMTTMPVVPSGMPVRRRLSAREVMWAWRFQMLKWGSILVLLSMVIAVVVAVFWPSGKTVSLTTPVTARGILTLQDMPITDARITLIPEAPDGKRATAQTDGSGAFILTTFLPGDGAIPGRYKVVVEKDPQFDRARMMPNIPETDQSFRAYITSPLFMDTGVHQLYGSERTTKLRVTVPPTGSSELKLILNYLGQ